MVALAAPGVARADTNTPSTAGASTDTPGWSYLYDGGAVPFFYVPLAVTLGLQLFAEPPSTPRWFSSDEGGAPFTGDTVPNWAVTAYTLAGAGVVALVPGEARWIHAKGYAQAVMTTAALTSIAKFTFGRRRPHYSDPTVPEERVSFFSGHSSLFFATSTYLSLYLNKRVFSRYRPADSVMAWWELLPYGAMLGGSTFVAMSRVSDNRHHKSDVITGGLVGAATASIFFWWQDTRYERASKVQLTITPRQVAFRMNF